MNLIEQLRDAVGTWPPSWIYSRRGPRFIVEHHAPNGAVFIVTSRQSERMAEIDVAAAIQPALDRILPEIDPRLCLMAERMGLSIIRECRRFSRSGGETDVDVYSLRRSLIAAGGRVLAEPTTDAAKIESAIAREAGQADAARDLLEPRTCTTPRG